MQDPLTAGPTLRDLYDIAPPRELAPTRTALVLVDFQAEFVHGALPLPGVDAAVMQARDLLAWARGAGLQVVFVRNVTHPGARLFAPDGPQSALLPELQPQGGERVVTKPTGGAFTRTELDALLRAAGIDTLVVAGLMTHLAVAMSAQDAAVLGYQVIVAADACATRPLPHPLGGPPIAADVLHASALAALADRFAAVMTTRSLRALPAPRPASRPRPPP